MSDLEVLTAYALIGITSVGTWEAFRFLWRRSGSDQAWAGAERELRRRHDRIRELYAERDRKRDAERPTIDGEFYVMGDGMHEQVWRNKGVI